MFLIFIDIHRNILSAQCAIVYSTLKDRNNFEVFLKKDVLSLYLCREPDLSQPTNITLPDGLFNACSISTTSCQIICINEEENVVKLTVPCSEKKDNSSEIVFQVDFRLKISDESILDKYIMKKSTDIKFKHFIKNKCKSSEMYKIICTNCGALLNEKTVSFQLVKEFHEGASELAETWFCHEHDNRDPQVQQPNSDILYIGDLYFYLHTSIITCLFLSEDKKDYKCSKCSSILSLKKSMNHSNYFGFFCDKVMFQTEDNECDIEVYKDDITLLSLCNVIEETLQSAFSCKIYFQSKVDDKTECLLLWINSQKILQFFLLMEDNVDIPNEIDFQLKEVYKLLYCDCAPDSELAKQWKHNFNVEFFQISDNMMKVVKQLLGRSSKYNSDDQKWFNGFKFGYLPANSFVL